MIDFYGTLGPSCCDEPTLYALFTEGMTGVRLNLSHSGLAACKAWIDCLHAASARAGMQTRLLIDLQGPELRVGPSLAPLALNKGEPVFLFENGKDSAFENTGIPVPLPLLNALEKDQEILLDDGALLLRCLAGKHLEKGVTAVSCVVVRGGVLQPRKSIAAPGCVLHTPTLTEADLGNLAVAAAYGVTGVMLPFVRDPEDLRALREALVAAGAPHIRILAKLENLAGVKMLPELLPHCDEIVIARGDLGNDMPLWELPAIQKQISALCRKAGKPFMVVTQMLHSMQKSQVPTRAEVSDIFNAVLDGASSLMLTGETAAGDYPVQAMEYLCRTAREAERYLAGTPDGELI